MGSANINIAFSGNWNIVTGSRTLFCSLCCCKLLGMDAFIMNISLSRQLAIPFLHNKISFVARGEELYRSIGSTVVDDARANARLCHT